MVTQRMEVGVLGATGTVGQQFAHLLAGHPWFKLSWLAASQRSEGLRYGDAAWRLSTPMPDEVRDLRVDAPVPGRGPRLLFSALDSSVAGPLEAELAAAGHVVVSNARNHRMSADVPLLVPEINPDHLSLLSEQRRAHAWPGAIVTNPNCSTVFLAMVLAALKSLSPTKVTVTTLQAVSGAGYPGVASLDILGNVVPNIDGEEAKIESETKKILGRLRQNAVEPHEVVISAQTTRVPVVNGHTEMISVAFADKPARADVLDALTRFSGVPQKRALPSAPPDPIVYLDQADRPQPRFDVERGGGMVVHVGRLRECPVLDYKLVALGHNTVRGAAGAAVLNAELMVAEGFLD
jgi:aspartate-semialdehyde dehydrogenase